MATDLKSREKNGSCRKERQVRVAKRTNKEAIAKHLMKTEVSRSLERSASLVTRTNLCNTGGWVGEMSRCEQEELQVKLLPLRYEGAEFA